MFPFPGKQTLHGSNFFLPLSSTCAQDFRRVDISQNISQQHVQVFKVGLHERYNFGTWQLWTVAVKSTSISFPCNLCSYLTMVSITFVQIFRLIQCEISFITSKDFQILGKISSLRFPKIRALISRAIGDHLGVTVLVQSNRLTKFLQFPLQLYLFEKVSIS